MPIHHKVLGEGVPVVMLHGWTLDHQVMLHAMEPLFEERSGWKRIYIDLPGMGRSDAPASIQNSDDLLDAVLRLLDELIPGEPFIVCGNSYGGYLARGIVYARREQVRGLLLLAPMTIPENEDRTVPGQTVLEVDHELISLLSPEEAEEFCSMGVVQGNSEWERFRDEVFLPTRQTQLDFVTQIHENGYSFTFNPSASLTYPTLIVTGRQDHVVGYQDAWRLLEDYPRATFAVLDMMGHNLQIEQPDVFSALVHNWLDRLESERFQTD